MAEIQRKLLKDVAKAGRIIDPGGRTMVRVEDGLVPDELREKGYVAVCDMGGVICYGPGEVEVTAIELDRMDPIADSDGYDVLVMGWQASVN